MQPFNGSHPNEGFIFALNKDHKFGANWVQPANSWTLTGADIFCRAAGFYGSLLAFTSNNYRYNYNYRYDHVSLTNLNCSGIEAYLSQCEHESFETLSYWNQVDLAAAICAINETDLNQPALRLIDKESEFNYNGLGFILMKAAGKNWSAVCDEEFSINEANAACRQMGYLGARDLHKGYESRIYDRFPNAPMVKVKCGGHGNESHLQDCHWEEIMCRSQEAVGVVCSGTQ